MLSAAKRRWPSLLAVAVFFGAWELICQLGWVSPVLLASPSRIAAAAPELLTRATVLRDLLYTGQVFALALLVAAVCGALLGALVGISPLAYQLLNPFIVSVNSLPKIVLVPLIVLWLGIGMAANVFLGALMASFPIIISTFSGVRSLDRDYVLLARAFGASRGKIARSVVLPGLVPYVLSGLRVGLNYAMVGVLISEFFASSKGVGYRMVLFMQNFEVDGFFVLLVLVATFTVSLTALLHALERRLSRWRPAAFSDGTEHA